MNNITRAPQLGKELSSNPIATERATPVLRKGRLSDLTGLGSFCSSSNMEVTVNSASERGMINLEDIEDIEDI